jgi:hypothetical protein
MGSSASLDPGLRLSLDPGRRTPPRPTPGLGLSLGLERRSPPRPTQGSDSASTPEDGLRLARPQGSAQKGKEERQYYHYDTCESCV